LVADNTAKIAFYCWTVS